MIKRIKNKKGITLIALVITIIVLLILAGVSIATLGGENGIIGKAKGAKSKSEYKKAEEDIKIVLNEYQIEKYKDNQLLLEDYLKVANEKKEIDGYADNVIENIYLIERNEYIFEIDKENLDIVNSYLTKDAKLLSEVAKVGDFVNYDVGKWTETVGKPTSQGKFGGYTEGTSKSTSTTGNNYSGGWRVLSISGTTVRLVHAGTPALYYHSSHTESVTNASIKSVNNFCNEHFLNKEYADSVASPQYGDAVGGVLSTSGLIAPGTQYWVTQIDSTDNMFNWNNSWVDYTGAGALGIRPMVTLKAGIRTIGSSKTGFTDKDGNETVGYNIIFAEK